MTDSTTIAAAPPRPTPGSEERGRSETELAIMGTTGHLVVIGPGSPSIEVLVEQLQALERCWSRFLVDSELSRLNRAGGRPSIVSHDTAMLVERAVYAWGRTGGRFDPTVLDAVRAAGYDRSFDTLAELVDTPAPPAPAPGAAGIDMATTIDLVRLPVGVGLDPGGIGKGLAADLVATAAVDMGAESAMVSLGGDLRVAGAAPDDGWEVEIDHHLAPPARINLRSGALATSSTLRRRWSTTNGEAHHVIDPRTGAPSATPAVACSVVASEGWWAEALATALLVGWAEPALEAELDEMLVGAGALVTLVDGSQRTVGPFASSFSPHDRPVPMEAS